MLESLKKKTLLGNLWCIIVLGIVTAALGVVFGSGIVKMLAGPAYFDPLDDHEDILSLQGQYITMDVDTLIDYYAETVRSESGKRDEVSAREYIMPINTPDATIYIGLEVPASKIDDAEAVVDDTARMLDDEDGNYEWDGSYVTVRGTLKRMDDETKQLWEDYFIDAGFSYDDIGLEDGCTFLPLVLTDDEIDGSDTFVLGFMGIVILLVLALLIWFVVRSLTGGFQKQIRNYIKASDDPQATEQALDRFYEDTMQDGKVRMSRSWLMYDKGGNSWVLAGDDVVWAYQYTVRKYKKERESHAKENICLGNEHGGSGDDYLHRMHTEQQHIQRHGQRNSTDDHAGGNRRLGQQPESFCGAVRNCRRDHRCRRPLRHL